MANRPDPAKEQFWRRMLRLQEQSGLSIRAFCQQHDLSEPSFYSWRTVIAQRDQQPAQAAAPVQDTAPPVPLFLPIRLQADPQPIEVVLADGTVVRVPTAFDADALVRLLAVLRGASC